MIDNKVIESSVIWLWNNTNVKDLSSKQMAMELCKLLHEGSQNVRITDSELAKRIGVSQWSIVKYVNNLIQSGEWEIVSQAGVGRTYTPLFLKYEK